MSEPTNAPAVDWDNRWIQQVLPHRYPFLLVDRVLEIEAGKRIVALKSVTVNEPFFAGHFPGFPVMPGVLIVEAMAQAAGLLALHGRPLAAWRRSAVLLKRLPELWTEIRSLRARLADLERGSRKGDV